MGLPGEGLVRGLSRGQWFGVIAGAVAAVLVTGIFALRSSGAEAVEVLLEPVGSVGPLPFRAADSDVVTTVPADLRFDAASGELVVAGTEPGLYGGSGQEVCDRDALIAFFAQDEAKAAAWAEVLGIEIDDIPSYLDGLTPAVLMADTWVTNHGYDEGTGQATPRQSVLQAGTAVLVDDQGVPRVRCRCGNPLTPAQIPADRDNIDYQGDPWDDFDPDQVVAIEAGDTVTELTMTDLTTGGRLAREVGTDGDADFALDDNGQRIQDITFTEPTVPPALSDDPLPLDATATSGLPVEYTAAGACDIVDDTLVVTEAGTCTLTISQPGDDVWAPAPDLEIEFDVGAGQQLILFEPPEVLAADDPPLELTATATSELPVEYSADGACEIIDDTLVVTEEGTCTLTITQPGDETWQPVERVYTLEVGPPANREAQTLSFPSPGNQPNGTTTTLRATATSGLPVRYTTSGACRASGTTLTPTRGGSCTITASQPGDGDWLPTSSITRTITITPGNGGTIPFDLPDTMLPGSEFPLPGLTTRGLPVTYSVEGNCTVSGGVLRLGDDGICQVVGAHPGNGDWRAVGVTDTTTIGTDVPIPEAQTISFPGLPSLELDQTVTLTATASSGLPLTYSASGGCTADGARLTATATTTCTVTASQPGNADWAPADPVTRSVDVAGRSQSITIAVSGPLFVGQTVTVTATATSGLDVALAATGDCRLAGATLTGATEGTCTITAEQPGSSEWQAATQTESVAVSRAPSPIEWSLPGELRLGDTRDFSVSTLADVSIDVQATGGCVLISPRVLEGVATGDCTITASHAGNTRYAPATETRTIPVLRRANVISWQAPTSVLEGSFFSVFANSTRTSSDGIEFNFVPETLTSGPCAPNDGGWSATGPGSCVFSATDPGDATWEPASGSFTVNVVAAPPPTAPPPSFVIG